MGVGKWLAFACGTLTLLCLIKAALDRGCCRTLSLAREPRQRFNLDVSFSHSQDTLGRFNPLGTTNARVQSRHWNVSFPGLLFTQTRIRLSSSVSQASEEMEFSVARTVPEGLSNVDARDVTNEFITDANTAWLRTLVYPKRRSLSRRMSVTKGSADSFVGSTLLRENYVFE